VFRTFTAGDKLQVKTDALDFLASQNVISHLDIRFARFLVEQFTKSDSRELALAAAMVSSDTRKGHICIDQRKLLDQAGQVESFPGEEAWMAALAGSAVVGKEGEYKPLILDSAGRLYLYRYWKYQDTLAQGIMKLIKESLPPDSLPAESIKEELDQLFPQGNAPSGEPDWQKIAALSAVLNKFCVISGGPGTGKTTTVAKILALLLLHANQKEKHVALAAPTGKAAARLQEAIKKAKGELQFPGIETVIHLIPEQASTLHRLLGTIQGKPAFRFNQANRLPFNIVVVDEASMVDLALMSKLVQALPDHARLILLGDKDQLASVEAGSVLGDICNTDQRLRYSKSFAHICEQFCGCPLGENDVIADGQRGSDGCIVQLQHCYRVQEGSTISTLSNAVREQNAAEALQLLKSAVCPESFFAWQETPSYNRLKDAIEKEVAEGFREYFGKIYDAVEAHASLQFENGAEILKNIFEKFTAFRVLCALRKGPYGVEYLNSLIKNILVEEKYKDMEWYPGRPVMVLENDYTLRLFNGDVGIYLPDIISGQGNRVFFPGAEGHYTAFLPQRIPRHETVYAMTVHKSQGSEFESVLFMLPDQMSPVLSRELVYTGITRARRKLSLMCSESILKEAIEKLTKRDSGLREALWGES